MQTIRYTETDFVLNKDRDYIERLRQNGRHIYTMRDRGGLSYSVETFALVNRFGYVVTDSDLIPYMETINDGKSYFIMDSDLFSHKDIELIHDDSVLEA